MSRPQLYRALARMYRFGPETVANMTPYQQLVYLQDDDQETGVVRFKTVAEWEEYRRSR